MCFCIGIYKDHVAKLTVKYKEYKILLEQLIKFVLSTDWNQ